MKYLITRADGEQSTIYSDKDKAQLATDYLSTTEVEIISEPVAIAPAILSALAEEEAVPVAKKGKAASK